jgi:hypothetical protein
MAISKPRQNQDHEGHEEDEIMSRRGTSRPRRNQNLDKIKTTRVMKMARVMKTARIMTGRTKEGAVGKKEGGVVRRCGGEGWEWGDDWEEIRGSIKEQGVSETTAT